MVKNAKEPKETIYIIKNYKELLVGENRKLINSGKAVRVAKKFKESYELFSRVGLR